MAKLVLINIEDPKTGWGHPALGIGYIASYIREYLHLDDIAIVDKEKNPFKAIKKLNPDVLGIGFCTEDFNAAVQLAKQVKSELGIPIIAGGQHISLIQHTLSKVFDICVIGEGEQTMLELMQLYLKENEFKKSNLKKIHGIGFHNNGDVVLTERRELIRPLDKIPFPARDLFKMKEYLAPRRSISDRMLSRGTQIMTSRGCPYKCVFCSSLNFWQSVRYHSPTYVVEEMKELIEKYKIDGIVIFDDLFAADKKRLKEIIELMKKEKIIGQLIFRCYTRVNFAADEETCELLQKMGVTDVNFGFESGSQKILSYLKKNTVSIEQGKKAIKNCKKHDIHVNGCFILGSPSETKEDMLTTLKFIKDNPIDTISLCLLTPFPGTELWEYAKQKGLVSDDMDFSRLHVEPSDLDNSLILNETMSKEEFSKTYYMIKKEIEKLNLKVSFRLSHLFSFSLWKRIISHPITSSKYLYYILQKNR